ncbi:MAG: hypothetical protein WD448_13740 [Woeseia sp.]
MNRNLVLICLLFLTLIAADASARDTVKQWRIADVLTNQAYAERLQGVSFFFGEQVYPAVVESLGEYRTNKKTNGFNKTDEEACQWVMLSALLALHERAQAVGANAVVNIRSNYKNNEVSSETEYTCGSGALMSGVALIGTFVRVE